MSKSEDHREHQGAEIRRARKEAGITQAELANSLGVSRRQLVRWERGQVKPRAATLAAVRQHLLDTYPADERPRIRIGTLSIEILSENEIRIRPSSGRDLRIATDGDTLTVETVDKREA